MVCEERDGKETGIGPYRLVLLPDPWHPENPHIVYSQPKCGDRMGEEGMNLIYKPTTLRGRGYYLHFTKEHTEAGEEAGDTVCHHPHCAMGPHACQTSSCIPTGPQEAGAVSPDTGTWGQ